MATWEDGPEYAPVERPDAFAEPSARIGLETPPPPPPDPVLPPEQPVFADPTQPVPPLASLVPEPPAGRDPKQPFAVASSVMTAESSAWASAHWAPPAPEGAQPGSVTRPAHQSPIAVSTTLGGGPDHSPAPYPSAPATNGAAAPAANGHAPANPTTYPAPVGNPTYPAPTGTPSYPPPPYPQTPYPQAPHPQTAYPQSPYSTHPNGAPFPPPSQPPAQGPFPAPGTTQWFAPGSYQQPAPVGAPDARGVLAAATPGMLVTLLIGGLIWILAPITLVLAFGLSRRMTYARKATQTAFAAVLAFLGLVGLVSIFTADGLFSEWWANVAGWGCFGSWVTLVVVAVLVYRSLKQGRPDPPPVSRANLR